MTIDLAGKVGIGTTNPTETVDISKNQNNPTSLRIANGASNAAAMANITLSTDNGDIGYLYAPSSAYPDAYLANHLNLESSSNADGLNLGAGGSGGIRFWTVSPSLGNERMYLANDGKLGIGTSLPGSAALEIVGTGANNSAILIPRNTTALRPAGANGMLRYNTNLAKFEFFESGAWKTYQTPGGAGAFYGTSSSLIPTGGLTSFWDVSGVQDHTSPTDKQMWHNYQLNSINRTTASLTNGTYTGTFSVKGEHHVAAGATNPGGHAGSSVEAYRNDTSSATPDYGTMQALIGSRIIVGHGTAPSGNPYTKELTGLEIEGTIGSGSVDYYKALRINGWSGTNPSSGSFGIYQESFNMANFFAGTVGIGTDQPRAALDVQGWGSTSAIIVPRDSGFSRPSPVEGMIRYNTTSNTFEGYSGGAWKDFTTATDAASTYLALNGGAVTGNTSFDQMVSIGGILAMVNGTNINMNGDPF